MPINIHVGRLLRKQVLPYRMLKAGEIVEKTDEYESFHTPGKFWPVAECTVGQKLLECNVGHYRRPISGTADMEIQIAMPLGEMAG